MKICGLIVEYNPFHNGHLHHLTRAKQLAGADYTVAVMSGNFVQRGEPALLDKWTRAEMAVSCGVDLVVELPTYYATASAEDFALGAVTALSRLGVDSICFGSESGDIDALRAVADIIDTPNDRFDAVFKEQLAAGAAYHAARAAAVNSCLNSTPDFAANNILAIEYLRAVRHLSHQPTMLTLARRGAAYLDADIDQPLASATGIRQHLAARTVDWQRVEQAMPAASFAKLYNYQHLTYLNDFKPLVNASVLAKGIRGLRQLRGIGEGLENRIVKQLSNVQSLDDTVAAIYSKRYPKSRIRRCLLNSLLNIRQGDRYEIGHVDYARILAYRVASRQLIRELKGRSELYLMTNLARDLKKYRRNNPLIMLDIRATGIYSQVNHAVHIQSDFRTAPRQVGG